MIINTSGIFIGRYANYESLSQHRPYYTIVVSLVYIGCFILSSRHGGINSPILEPYILDTAYPQQVWRLYTCSFLHINLLHITSNCIMLLIMGLMLNMKHGNIRFGIIHTLGVIGGSLGIGWQLRLMPPLTNRITAVGASGGVYALIGAHYGNIFLNWGEIPYHYWRLGIMLFLAAADISMYFVDYDPKIAYSSHLFGFLTGAVVSSICLINIKILPYERRVQIICGIIFVIGFAASFYNYLNF